MNKAPATLTTALLIASMTLCAFGFVAFPVMSRS